MIPLRNPLIDVPISLPYQATAGLGANAMSTPLQEGPVRSTYLTYNNCPGEAQAALCKCRYYGDNPHARI